MEGWRVEVQASSRRRGPRSPRPGGRVSDACGQSNSWGT